MISDQQNPFDALGLPPTASPEEITEALRERIEDAGPAERAALRALWERMMRHPRERILLALGAHPRGALTPPDAPPISPDPTAAEEVASFVTPPDELVPLPLASAAVEHPPVPDPLVVLAAELGDET